MLDGSADMSVEGRIARLESELEDMSIVGDATNKEIFKLQGRFDRLSKDFDEIAEGASAEDLAQVQSSLDEMGSRFKAVEESLASHTQEAQERVEQVRGDLEKLRDAQGQAQNKFEEFELGVEERLEAVKAELSQASTFLKSEDFEKYRQGQEEELNKERDSQKEALEALKGELSQRLEEGLKRSAEDREALVAKTVSDLKGESERNLFELEERLEGKASQQEEGLKGLEASLNHLKEMMNGADSAMETLQSLRGEVDKLAERITEFAPRCDEALAQAAKSQEEVEQHLGTIRMAMRLVEQLDQRVTEIGKNAESLTEAAAEAVAAAPKIAASMAQAAQAAQAAGPAPVVVAAQAPRVEVIEEEPIPPVTENLGYDLGDILQVVISHGASDLHLQVGCTPTVRLNGDLVPVGETKLATDDTKALIYPAMTREQRQAVRQGKEVSFSHVTADGVRFLVSAFLERGNLSANFHMLRTDVLPFEALGLPPVLKKFSLFQNGLVILTGPTGSGKSTTMASMVDFINNNRKCHIVTIEDPIEYYHKTVNSLITQREVGDDTQSFRDAINTAMRQDPDVLVISDIRDAETMMSAISAAEKGYLVIAALNTPDTLQALRRMLTFFTGETQRQFRLLLASCLRGIVSQKLVARADDKGRIPAIEVLVVDLPVSEYILNDDFEALAAYQQQSGVEGMQSFGQSMGALYAQGLIAKDEEIFHEVPAPEFPVDPVIHNAEPQQSDIGDNDTIMNWL